MGSDALPAAYCPYAALTYPEMTAASGAYKGHSLGLDSPCSLTVHAPPRLHPQSSRVPFFPCCTASRSDRVQNFVCAYKDVTTACNSNAAVPYCWLRNVRCALTAVQELCRHGTPHRAWTAAVVTGKVLWLVSAPSPWTPLLLPPVRAILVTIYAVMVSQGERIEWLVLHHAVVHPPGPPSNITQAVDSVPCMHCLHEVVKAPSGVAAAIMREYKAPMCILQTCMSSWHTL